MNIEEIIEIFRNTLSGNNEIRTKAEQDLKNLSKIPGSLSAICQAIQSPTSSNVEKNSAAVYLKNRVKKAWTSLELANGEVDEIFEVDKEYIKANIFNVLACSDDKTSTFISSAIYYILVGDFPDRWPNFMNIVSEMLKSNDPNVLHCGLISLHELFRFLIVKSGKRGNMINVLVDSIFPQLLVICTSLVSNDSNEAAILLKLCLKIYFKSIRVGLPPSQQDPNNLVAWGNIFIKVAERSIPNNILPEDESLREDLPWVKARKWGFRVLNILFERYGNPSNLDKSSEYYKFACQFVKHFAPNIMNVYFEQFYLALEGKVWMSDKCLFLVSDFFQSGINNKITWNIFKPHTDRVVKEFIFSNICYSDEEEEDFDDNPAEFVLRRLEDEVDKVSPFMGAFNLLLALVSERKKYTLSGVLEIIFAVLVRHQNSPPSPQVDREKDSALAMLEVIYVEVMNANSKIRTEIEQLLVTGVLPELKSSNPLLRFRAGSVLIRYADFGFSNDSTALSAYTNLVPLLQDPKVPNRVVAAVGIESLLKYEPVEKQTESVAPQILEQLLILTNQIDIEQLSQVIETFVDVYTDKLVPYSLQLTQSLTNTLMRIFSELPQNSASGDDFDIQDSRGDVQNKIYSASGILRTIGTILFNLQGKSNEQLLTNLEALLTPVVMFILQNEIYDLYEESVELADAIVYNSGTVPSSIWHVFEIVHDHTLNHNDFEMEHIQSFLDSLLTNGLDTIAQNPQIQNKMLSLCASAMEQEEAEVDNQIAAIKVLLVMVLNLHQHIHAVSVPCLKLTFRHLIDSERIKDKRLRTQLIKLVVACLATDFSTALQVLEENQWTSGFFTMWFQQFDLLFGVHDKKMCIIALCNIINVPFEQLPETLKNGWSQILTAISLNFKSLPEALENRNKAYEEIKGNFEEGDDALSAMAEGGTVEENDHDDDDDDDDDSIDLNPEDQAKLEALVNEASVAKKGNRGSDDEDDDYYDGDDYYGDVIEAEPSKSPIDEINVHILFRNTIKNLEARDYEAYNSMIAGLSQEDKVTLTEVVEQAEIHSQLQNQSNPQDSLSNKA